MAKGVLFLFGIFALFWLVSNREPTGVVDKENSTAASTAAQSSANPSAGVSPAPTANPPPSTKPASASPESRDYPLSGQKGTLKFDTIGCHSREIYDRYFQIIIARDRQAAEKFGLQYLMSGDCEVLKEGTEVTVEQMPFFSDNFCVRARGEISCLWTNKGLVKKSS